MDAVTNRNDFATAIQKNSSNFGHYNENFESAGTSYRRVAVRLTCISSGDRKMASSDVCKSALIFLKAMKDSQTTDTDSTCKLKISCTFLVV